MSEEKKVKKGDVVSIEYEGRLKNGQVFDSTDAHGGKPLEFESGAGQVVSGFDKAVEGLKEGEEKEFTLKPEDAYGEHRKELEKKIPKDQIPPMEKEIKPGATLMVSTPDGRQAPVKVSAVDEDTITLDLNHPLAGKTLVFKTKVVAINSKS